MKSNRNICRCFVGAVCVFTAWAALPGHANAPDAATLKKINRATVPFVVNAGQWDARAAFAAQTFAGTVFVTQDGALVYSLPGKPIVDESRESDAAQPSRRGRGIAKAPEQRTPGWSLTERFVDRDNQPLLAKAHGFRPQTAQVNYFIGNDEAKHQRGVSTYERVNLGDIYPGINVQVRATGNNVEKIFTVAPTQNPAQIKVKLSGATKLEVNAEGALIAHTDNGPVVYTAPIAFQEDALGNKESVAVYYALNSEQNTYGFTLDVYDTQRPLVIDPLIKSTYLGALGDDEATAIAIHPSTGDVYVAGFTNSSTTTFPGVNGGAQSGLGGNYDAFVSRFSADLTTLIKSSYLGALGGDRANALAVHPATGEIYVAGYTTSTANTFPGVGGSAQGTNAGGLDAFVSRFSADLGTLIKSSYLGTAVEDVANALAIHPATGDVYVAGYTYVAAANFPGVSGGAQGSSGGNSDAFDSRFSADLTTLIKSSYLGGAGTEEANALAIHPATGEVYMAGYTSSDTTSFPGVSGGAQGNFGGNYDAFVARFSADLTTLIKSSYLGAGGSDVAKALAIHPATGDVYVAGFTSVATASFPGVSGGAQGSFGGAVYDAFVSRLSADLTTLIKSSYVGAAGDDVAKALAIHPTTGEVYVAGYTNSATTTFPGVSGGAQGSFGGVQDAFVSRFSADLTRLIKSSYLGAAGDDEANALAIHPTTGEVYLAGYTASATTSFPGVSGGAQGSNGGGNDAFVSRFSADLTANDTTPAPFSFISQTIVPVASVRTSNPALISGIIGPANIYVDGAFGSSYCISAANNCSCDVSGALLTGPSTVSNGQYVCARHTSASTPNAVTQTNVHVGGAVGRFFVSTGTAFTSCNLDIDGDSLIAGGKEGLILLRAMLGFTGAATTAGTGISAAQWAFVRPTINANCGTNFAP